MLSVGAPTLAGTSMFNFLHSQGRLTNGDMGMGHSWLKWVGQLKGRWVGQLLLKWVGQLKGRWVGQLLLKWVGQLKGRWVGQLWQSELLAVLGGYAQKMLVFRGVPFPIRCRPF